MKQTVKPLHLKQFHLLLRNGCFLVAPKFILFHYFNVFFFFISKLSLIYDKHSNCKKQMKNVKCNYLLNHIYYTRSSRMYYDYVLSVCLSVIKRFSEITYLVLFINLFFILSFAVSKTYNLVNEQAN